MSSKSRGVPDKVVGDSSLSSAKLLNSFMWNDRDCEAKNHFICERTMNGQAGEGEDEREDYSSNNQGNRQRESQVYFLLTHQVSVH